MEPYLPVELYRAITENIQSRQTLQTLLVTSREWNIEAERALYMNFDNVQSGVSQTMFLERIIACPRVGALVRLYKVSMNFPLKSSDSAAIISLAVKALPYMTNLRSLAFRTIGGQPAAHILPGNAFQLTEFSWGCHGDEKNLLVFLAQQPTIRILNIDSWDACRGAECVAVVPPDITPDIVSLSGRYGTIEAFLGGRTITKLEWIPDLDDPEPDVERIGEALRGVHVLMFGGYFMRPDLASIARYLSGLTDLELRGIQADDLDCITLLPRLERLIISMQWVQELPVSSADEVQRALALKLLRGCPTLTMITIASKKHDNWSADYKRWTRPQHVLGEDLKPEMLHPLDVPFRLRAQGYISDVMDK